MEKTNSYVCGFMFDPTGQQVLLTQKARPTWQAGKWNGIGGKIEPNETSLAAMHREFQEETGIVTLGYDNGWQKFCSVDIAAGGFVDFYKMSHDVVYRHAQQTDEPLGMFPWFRLPNVIYNLKWLIPLARDFSLSGPLMGKFKPVEK